MGKANSIVTLQLNKANQQLEFLMIIKFLYLDAFAVLNLLVELFNHFFFDCSNSSDTKAIFSD
jgi:hypothetical protein